MEDFDLSGLEVTEEIARNGFGDLRHVGKKPIPRFYWEAVINKYKTEREGRPITDKRLFCEERCVGQKDQPGHKEVKFVTNHLGRVVPDPQNIIVRRYPVELKKFLEAGESVPEGLPLEQWPPMTRDMIAVCHFLEIRTVEQLAGCKDNEMALQKLGPGSRSLVLRAEAFLTSNREEAFAERLTVEKEELNQKILLQQDQINDLIKRLNTMVAPSEERPSLAKRKYTRRIQTKASKEEVQ